MTVFKTILTLIKRNLVYGIITLATLVAIIPFVANKATTIEGYKYTVCYNGNIKNATSEEKNLIKYLGKYNIEHQSYTDEEIKVVDALNIYELIINLNEKDKAKRLLIKNEILGLEINQFIGYLNYYDDFLKAKNIMSVGVNTKQLDYKVTNTKTTVNSFLMYQISLFVILISMQIFDFLYKENIENKRIVSSIKPSKYMIEILMGMSVVVLIAVIASILISSIFVKYTLKALIFNLINFSFFAISILTMSSLICRITTNRQIASGIANTITLSLAFTSGGFIPQEVIKPGFLKFAKLFPEYYAIKNVHIEQFNIDFLKNLGIIALFSLVYYIASVFLARQKDKNLK